MISEKMKFKGEDPFRVIFEAAPNGMIMVDDHGQILLLNSEVEKIFGYSKEELLGQKIELLIPARFHQQHPHYRKDFFKAPAKRAVGAGRDLFGLRKDGSEFPVEIGLNPVITKEGIFVISSVVDITERKYTEEQIKKANETLHLANQMKSTFISMVSHELRTPLSSMKSSTDILLNELEGPINEEQRETLNITKRNIDRLSRLISNVLDYSRLEAGKMAMVYEKTDLHELVNEVCHSVTTDLHEKNLQLIQELSSDPLSIVCDSDKCKQVLLNLLNNAIKFTETGTIYLRVIPENHDIRFEVQDTGIGIPKEDHEKIFKMFEQSQQGEHLKSGGSGIGLAVAQLIVQEQKGKITVASEPGKGATFRVWIPRSP